MIERIPSFVQTPPSMLTLILRRAGTLKVAGFDVPFIMHFPVLPESMNILKSYLVKVTSTPDGGWVDDYGEAPHPITISGTFGYNTKGFIGKGVMTGFGWSKYLEWIVHESHRINSEGELPELWMYSWVSQHFYRIVAENINIQQSTQRSMLWVYRMQIIALPGENNVIQDVIEESTIFKAVTATVKNYDNIISMRL